MGNSLRTYVWIGILGVGFLACGATVNARVTRIAVEQKESPAYGGQAFGKAG